MKVKTVYKVDDNNVRYLLRRGIGGLFIFSTAMKVLAADYMMDLLFTLMPISWIGWMNEGFLLTGLLVLAAVELLLGILLWRGIWLSKVLSVTILFLTVMIFLNGYQLWSGVADCGCLGGWISMPPKVSFAKTLVLLGMAIYLKFVHQEFGRFYNLSTNQS